MSSLTKTRINKRLGPTNIVTKRMLPFVLSAVVGGELLCLSIASVGLALDNSTGSIDGEDDFSDHIVTPTREANATVNLFDYWAYDGCNTADGSECGDRVSLDGGINKNHLFLFHTSTGWWNTWFREGNLPYGHDSSGLPYTGMVDHVLGDDGYPVISLPDEDIAEVSALAGRPNNESMAYLFDPDIDVDGKASYPNVKGLFNYKVGRGNYFNAKENFASYNRDTNSFVIYDTPAVQPVGRGGTLGQFFPFANAQDVLIRNDDGSVVANDSVDANTDMNHLFGMTIEASFKQPKDGVELNPETGQNQEMRYEFSGDDDIWIFIDDVLVVDLGGVHDSAMADVNFATGKVTISSDIDPDEPSYEYYIGEMVENVADRLDSDYINDNMIKETDADGNVVRYTYKDDTRHDMKIFYLERGAGDSNLQTSFWPSLNGVVYPEEDPDPEPEPEPEPDEPILDPETPSEPESATPEQPNDNADLPGVPSTGVFIREHIAGIVCGVIIMVSVVFLIATRRTACHRGGDKS